MPRRPTEDPAADPVARDAPAGIVWTALIPVAFVIVWSTGFPFAKLGLPYAEPFTFLMWRYVVTAAVFVVLALALRARWPATTAEAWHAAVVGTLIQAGHIGGIFWAIKLGVNSGVVAIVVGIHPVLTAVCAGPYLGERVPARQWLGFVLGVGGTALVVSDKVSMAVGGVGGAIGCIVALLSISAGMLYQKRHGGTGDLMSGNAIQFTAAALVCGAVAAGTETMQVTWTGEFLIALGWLVLVLSVGAVTVLYVLMRRGAASRVAAFFFLVAPTAALWGLLMFGETLTVLAFAGMATTAAGVALVTVERRP